MVTNRKLNIKECDDNEYLQKFPIIWTSILIKEDLPNNRRYTAKQYFN